jgi:type IV secretory pathway VirB10-like protein
MIKRNNVNQHRRNAKTTFAVVGAGAFAALVALGVVGNHAATAANYQASSGDAPTNTTYAQPSVPAMSMGATATFTPPGTEAPTEVASPVVKAAPYSGG